MEETGPTFEFTGFDFSTIVQGGEAATFTELFADVLNAAGGAEGARPEAGADLHSALTVSFEDAMRGVDRQVIVTRQDVCGATLLEVLAGQVALRVTDPRWDVPVALEPIPRGEG